MSRMPELDFIEVIQSKPLTPEEAAEISAFIRKGREARAKAKAAREKLEAKALALPPAERKQLAYRLISSLAADESDPSERAWAEAAKVQFDQLHPTPTPALSAEKPRRRTKPSAAKRQ